jgi:nucleoid-associated protein YgaU
VIEKGDSLYDISLKKYGTISMIEAIAKANNLQNENLIQEGETIVLP